MDLPVLIFDLVVIAIILMSIIIGMLRGFIRETLTIIGVVGGAFAAYVVGPLLAPVFNNWLVGGDDVPEEDIPTLFGVIPYDMLADFLAYGSVFIIVVIVLSLMSHMLAGWVKALGLGVFDRALGVVFGVVRAVVVIGILYLLPFMLTTQEDRQEWFGDAYTFTPVERVTAQLQKFMPESVKEEVDSAEEKESIADRLRQEVEEKFQEVTGDRNSSDRGKADEDENAQEVEEIQEPQELQEPAPLPSDTPSGYEDNERQRLDQLFEEGADDPAATEGTQNE